MTRYPLLLSFLLVTVLSGCSKMSYEASVDGKEPNIELPAIPPVHKADLENLVDGGNQFAFELYGKLKSSPGNVFCSPYSISSALAMTYAGARGTTKAEMEQVLHLDKLDSVHGAAGQLTRNLQPHPTDVYQLAIANRIWPREGMALLPQFEKTVSTYYGSDIVPLDFSVPTANETINLWVEEHTNHKIKNLVPSLPATTTMVLTNAIYFKGDWKHAFKRTDTREAEFFITPDNSVQVPMMSQTEEQFPFHDFGTFQMLEMPYEGERLSMVVLLPSKQTLNELEEELSAAKFDNWHAQLETKDVYLSFPRFKFTRDYELSRPLQELGMVAAFESADFSGMSSSNVGCIDRVLHKAFIEVNEEGTEAAAATAVTQTVALRGPVVRVDRPFLFAIRDAASGCILFLGRVVDPTKGVSE